MNTKQIMIFCVALLLIGGAYVLGTKKNKPQVAEKEAEPAKPQLPPNTYHMSLAAQRNIQLQTAVAQQEVITRTVHVTGTVTADESKIAHVFPLAQGVVQRVFVQLGSEVRTGQSMLRYDNVELGNVTGEHRSLLGNLEKARAQEDVSAKSLARAENLRRIEAISQREYELRVAEKEQADAGVNSAKAELATSEEKLHRFGLSEAQVRTLSSGVSHRTSSLNDLRAPISGVVSKYDVAAGELVGPNKETFTIVDPSVLWVLADVYEKDLDSVPQRGVCRVSLAAYPKETFVGSVTYISESIDPQSRTAKLRCVVPNADRRIRVDMFAELEIPTTKKDLTLTIPNEAIQEVDNEPVVFVQKGPEQFERRKVNLGSKGDITTEILSGVKAGERVVTSGTLQLKFEALRGTLGND